MKAKPSYLERYLQGEHARVWQELADLEVEAFDGLQRHQAQAVARETMRRVRDNILTLINRLPGLGYVFGIYPDGSEIPGFDEPYHGPVEDVAEIISRLEADPGIGAIPLALKTFWEIVGEVNLMGHHPRWPAYTDPLVVDPIWRVMPEFQDWLDTVQAGLAEPGEFEIPLAPDFFHKDNISGGAPYVVRVPNTAVDAVLEYEPHNTTFVNYLRICFQYGGFPGFHWLPGEIPVEIRQLSADLLPI